MKNEAEKTRALLRKHGQEHVLRFMDQLDSACQSKLLQQVSSLDFEVLSRMRQALQEAAVMAKHAQLPAPAAVISLSEAERVAALHVGEKLLTDGRVGVILVAGGQGSRLGFDGPKGCYAIAPLSGASLFEIHSGKIKALEQKYNTEIPFYIMTSEANDAATRAFFDENNYFGREKGNTIFFAQGMWPALTPDGRLILDAPDHVFVNPDGHGGLPAALQRHDLFNDMQQRGVKTLFYFQVDNPLVNVADPVFLGIHAEHHAEYSIKVCTKRDADEGLGNVITDGHRHYMLEYTELTAEQKHAREADGRLRYYFGSTAIHVFDRDFLQQQAKLPLPLHIAKKKVNYCGDDGQVIEPEAANACKFEKFIFDMLPRAKRSINLEFDRTEEFSPLKNAVGFDSVETCQRDMALKWARWLEECGVDVPRNEAGAPAVRIEINPCYALGPEDLMAQLPTDFKISGDTLLQPE